MKKRQGIKIRHGSTNVYADLGFPHAASMKRKAAIATEIALARKRLRLSYDSAASWMGTTSAVLRKILRGQFQYISEKRMRAWLATLVQARSGERPRYEPDDGPLTARQWRAIRALPPKRIGKVRSSIIPSIVDPPEHLRPALEELIRETPRAVPVASGWDTMAPLDAERTPAEELEQLVADIEKAARKILGSKKAASDWLGRRKRALGDKSPIACMRTRAGARRVMRLLEAIKDRAFQ